MLAQCPYHVPLDTIATIVLQILDSPFLCAVRELDVPGDLYERKTYPFEFSTVEMPYESYNGVNIRLRYVVYPTSIVMTVFF